jgi:hypothetical protein
MAEIECFEEVHTVISTSFRHGMMATKKVRFFEISTDVFTATGIKSPHVPFLKKVGGGAERGGGYYF